MIFSFKDLLQFKDFLKNDRTFPTDRIRSFSDAVFGIAVTLLILNLVDSLNMSTSKGVVTNQVILNALLQTAPKFISFALSFFLVCILWVNHHQFFYLVKKTDRWLLWFNNLLLFWVCFMPFPTAFLAQYFPNILATTLFGLSSACLGISFALMGDYAISKVELIDKSVTPKTLKGLQKRSYWGIFVTLFLIIISIILVIISFVVPIPAFASVLLFIAFYCVPLRYFIPPRI